MRFCICCVLFILYSIELLSKKLENKKIFPFFNARSRVFSSVGRIMATENPELDSYIIKSSDSVEDIGAEVFRELRRKCFESRI